VCLVGLGGGGGLGGEMTQALYAHMNNKKEKLEKNKNKKNINLKKKKRLGFELRASVCKTGTLLLEPHLQSICAGYSDEKGVVNYLPRLSSNGDLPILASQVARITDVSHCCPASIFCFLIYTLLCITFFLLLAFCLVCSYFSSLTH
jgi:hypothetical protein